ncbi:unnamed protein product [Phyllotreta striolata]|uniref:Uncharacterized protein n=1 Tax=Phyllotreta striolata TaxID=444603 RepID=A0A9N9TUQ4_PHYSR|nr:unnamed protein product [Phyllotreta striolata]
MNKLDFSNLCRICLTRTNHMVHLTSSFNEIFVEIQKCLSIADVINIVLHFTPKLSGQHPQFICLMCLDALKTAYDFWTICNESRQIIQQCLGEPEEETIPINSNESNASVELIAGPNKYNINDLLIVEDEKDKADELFFKGFLNNLGKSVTVTFVDKDNSKKANVKQNDVPSVEVEELSFDNKKEHSVHSRTRQRSNTLDEYILVEGKELHSKIDEEIMLPNNTINVLDNIDKELLESALNLKYECTVCKKIFAREVRYKKHIEQCGSKTKISNTNDRFTPQSHCRYCPKSFNQQKYLNHHVNITHRIPFYTCEICKTKLKNKRAYSYHKMTKHTDVQHVCQYCGKTLVTAWALKLHIEIHTSRDTPQCVCPVCGKTFHYKGGLFYHMKQHTDERKYKCDFCDRSFYTLFAKKRHVRTHTGVRPYACQFCDKRFFSLGEKKRHEWIHTGTLPYRCKYCNKGFTSNYNMKVHCFNHAGDFACEYCNKSFIDDGVLQFHYKIKHKDLSLSGGEDGY